MLSGVKSYTGFIKENRFVKNLTLALLGFLLLIYAMGGVVLQLLLRGELEYTMETLAIILVAAVLLLAPVGLFFVVRRTADKIFWHESILDAIPFPLSVTDMDMNWTFINKPVEEMLKLSRFEMIGKHCSNWGAGICNTADCGIECLRRGKNMTFFNQLGMNFKVDAHHLYSLSNTAIGHIEVVQDITGLLASREKLIGDVRDISTEFTNISAELAKETQTNAATAGKTAKLAEAIKANAESSAQHMGEMTQAVSEINEANLAIRKVTQVIDDIARRTNILALNASVEAARGGEQGKAFAVVAEEVRNLAQESTVQVKDTEALIENSISKAELGAQIAGDTAKAILEIVSSITESNRLIAEIAESSEKQKDAINHVHGGIEKMSRILMDSDGAGF